MNAPSVLTCDGILGQSQTLLHGRYVVGWSLPFALSITCLPYVIIFTCVTLLLVVPSLSDRLLGTSVR